MELLHGGVCEVEFVEQSKHPHNTKNTMREMTMIKSDWGNKLNVIKRIQDSSSSPISNYKSFQESWRVKLFSHLTKIIEKNTKICNVKWVYYENIIKEESNDT